MKCKKNKIKWETTDIVGYTLCAVTCFAIGWYADDMANSVKKLIKK
jgi:hypothetical protein